MSAPFARLDSRHFMWMGEVIVTSICGDFFFYADQRWRGPFSTLRALELAASE